MDIKAPLIAFILMPYSDGLINLYNRTINCRNLSIHLEDRGIQEIYKRAPQPNKYKPSTKQV